MRSKIFVTCSLLICLALLLSASAPSFAKRLAPGKIGFFGKGKVARAQTPDLTYIRRPDGTQSQANDSEIWVYPSGNKPGSLDATSQDLDDIQWALDNIGRKSDGSPGLVILKATLKGTSTYKEFYMPKMPNPNWADLTAMRDVILSGEVLTGRVFQNTGTDLDGTPLMATIRDGIRVIETNYGDNEFYYGQTKYAKIQNIASIGAKHCFFVAYRTAGKARNDDGSYPGSPLV